MQYRQISFLFLNIGHFLDHLFMLVFATAAALILAREWGFGYAELITYATPGFIAFAVCSIPAGWIADKWSREGMMAIFFIGIGLSSIATATAQSPLQISFGLLAIGGLGVAYFALGIWLFLTTPSQGTDSLARNMFVWIDHLIVRLKTLLPARFRGPEAER